mgnify:FL=1
MDDRAALELLIRLQSRAIADMARRLEEVNRELAAVKAATERSAAVSAALLQQIERQTTSGVLGWADRNPWPAVAIAILLLLGLTGQLYLLPQLAPAVGGVRASP